ncbi:hypothetical protein Vretimale_18860, partial [Volvox reticuliferus]
KCIKIALFVTTGLASVEKQLAMAAFGYQDAPLNELAANILGSRCPYNALGLTTDANLAEVKSAYRRLCLTFHPDKSVLPCQLASEVFQALQKAYADVEQHLKHVHQLSALDKGDLWCQFYTAPAVSSEAGAYVAPTSAVGGPMRPAHAPRQGSLWGSARGPVTSAWSRQNTASAPTAHAEAKAASVDVDGAQHGDKPHVGDIPAPNVERKGLGAAAAPPSQPHARRRVARAAMQPEPHAHCNNRRAHKPAADSSTAAADTMIPAGKRRCVAAEKSKQHQAVVAPSESSSSEFLQRRGVSKGLEGHVVPGERGSRPSSMKSPGHEYPGNIFIRKQIGKDATAGPQQASEPNSELVQGPQPGNAWARRPIFSAVVRQALYPSFIAKDQLQSTAAAASMGNGDKKRLRTFAEHTPERFCTEGGTPGSASWQGAADDRMTPPSTSNKHACSSSGTEEDLWDVPQVVAARSMAATNGLQPAAGALWNQSPAAAAHPLASQAKDATTERRKCTSASAETEPPRVPIRDVVDVTGNVAITRRGDKWLPRQDGDLVDGMHPGVTSVLHTTVGTAAPQPNSLAPASFCAATVPCVGTSSLSLGLQPNACDMPSAPSVIPSSRFYEVPTRTFAAHVVTQPLATRSSHWSRDAACPGDGHESGDRSQQQLEYMEHRTSGHGSGLAHGADGYDEERSLKVDDADGPLASSSTGKCAVGSDALDEPEFDVPPCQFNENGDDAEPDWWHDEPIAGNDGTWLPGVASEQLLQRDGLETAGTHGLDMFLEQVQQGRELQAQRTGQARLRNVHRIVLRGCRGKGRRGGASCTASRCTGGSGGRARGSKGVRGRHGTKSILQYSRPVRK